MNCIDFPLHPTGGGVDMPSASEDAGDLRHVDVPLRTQAQFETPIRQLRVEDGNLDSPNAPRKIDKTFGVIGRSSGGFKRPLRDGQRSDTTSFIDGQCGKNGG